MESLSSFIGVDGTNTTLNSGRILINLKPLAERKDQRDRRDHPLAAETGADLGNHSVHAAGAGSDRRRSREPDAVSIHAGRSEQRRTERLCAAPGGAGCSKRRNCATWPAISRCLGLQARLVYDRVTASRLGITPSAIDQTLYDAYGQRQVSTMFTQLNQYHVVLEVKPNFQSTPIDLRGLFVRTGAAGGSSGVVAGGTGTAVTSGPTSSAIASQASLNSTGSSSAAGAAAIASTTAFPNGGQVPLAAFSTAGDSHGAHRDQPSGPVSGGHAVVQSGARTRRSAKPWKR